MATSKKTTSRNTKVAAKTKRTVKARKAAPAPIMTKGQAVALLKKGVCQVTFRKEDGTLRKMFATLHPNDVPEIQDKVGGSVRNTVTAWDVESYGWRSFRIDRLRKLAIRRA